jgi:ABC-type transport system involved in multi-copper enzyme maturation permease subunit
MRNILTITKRELFAFFTSLIGYIYLIVFLVFSVGLYVTPFFLRPEADMRAFFSNVPLLLCVFIPAVTMRTWAEDRKENTYELLLTFPMRASQLALGKYLANFIFYLIALACTWTVPVMLAWLGNPDNGVLVSGYLGLVLLGMLFLAIGQFASGLVKDQITSFVIALGLCFGIYLVGTQFFAANIVSTLESVLPFLAGMPLETILSRTIGVIDHYEAFARGVVDLSDVLYFAIWIALFLTLNVLFIDGRSRPRARTAFTVSCVVAALIGMASNYLLTDTSFGRFDLTEDKIHTVPDAAGEILAELPAPVTVNVYMSPEQEMPTGMKDLQRNVVDKLEELAIISGGQLEYNVIPLSVSEFYAELEQEREETLATPAAETAGDDAEAAGEPDDEARSIERRMLDKGIEPISVQALAQGEMTSKQVYSSIGIAYRDKAEEIIPAVLPQLLPELDYQILRTVLRLSREEPPVVAMVAPDSDIPPEVRQMYQQMGQPLPQTPDPYQGVMQILQAEDFRVRRVELTQDSPLPEDFDVLLVISPSSLSERQLWELNRAIHSGKPAILAIHRYEWNYDTTREGLTFTKNEITPNINPLLEAYGATVDEAILLDRNYAALQMSTGNALQDLLGGGMLVETPVHVIVNPGSMNQDVSITAQMGPFFYLWGTALELDEEKLGENGLDATVLMTTSDEAWKVSSALGPDELNRALRPGDPPEEGVMQFPLAVMLEGAFPDAFAGEERPAWPAPQPQPGQPPMPPPEEEGPAEPVEAAPGKVLLLGAGAPFRTNFLSSREFDNALMLRNAVDVMALGDQLVEVRSRQIVNRAIDRLSDRQRTFWKFANYGLMNIVILVVAIGVAVTRRRARDAYTMAHRAEE